MSTDNLNWYYDEVELIKNKFNEARIDSSFPELYNIPTFIEYVFKKELNNIDQSNIDDLFNSYKNEMLDMFEKVKNAIMAKRILSILFILIGILTVYLGFPFFSMFFFLIYFVMHLLHPKYFIL